METRDFLPPIKISQVIGIDEFKDLDIIDTPELLEKYVKKFGLDNWQQLVDKAEINGFIKGCQVSFTFQPSEINNVNVVTPEIEENNSQLDIKTIDFYDDQIISIKNLKTGEVYVPVRRLCNNLGLSTNGQLKKIKNAPHIWEQEYIVIPINGINQKTLCLPISKLEAWLLSINSNKVKLELKDKLLSYQKECIEVLHNYWNGSGTVVNNRKINTSDLNNIDNVDPNNINSVQNFINILNDNIGQLTDHISYITNQFNHSVKIITEQKDLINEMTPKAEDYETFMSIGDNLTIQEFSKSIPLTVTYSDGSTSNNIGSIKMFDLLRKLGYLINQPGSYTHNMPYQRYVNLGLFDTRIVNLKQGGSNSASQTLITPKRVQYLIKKFRKYNWLPQSFYNDYQKQIPQFPSK
jgi:phage antirepressor YoqD-like protein